MCVGTYVCTYACMHKDLYNIVYIFNFAYTYWNTLTHTQEIRKNTFYCNGTRAPRHKGSLRMQKIQAPMVGPAPLLEFKPHTYVVCVYIYYKFLHIQIWISIGICCGYVQSSFGVRGFLESRVEPVPHSTSWKHWRQMNTRSILLLGFRV